MLNFILSTTSIFLFLSPFIVVGKILDFHVKRTGQEHAKEVIGRLYLNASYGYLFTEYCNYILDKLNKNAIAILALVLVFFLVTALAINFYIFRSTHISNFIFVTYSSIAFALLPISLIDLYVTKKVVTLAAGGRYALTLAVSLLSIYILLSISEAVLSTFFIGFGFDLHLYATLFANRLGIVFSDPIGHSMSFSSHDHIVYVSAFAFPTVAISSSTIVAGIAIACFSSRSFQPLLNYLADRVLSNDEKAIYRKLATLICALLALFISAAYSLIW